jgi:hypothetical protein
MTMTAPTPTRRRTNRFRTRSLETAAIAATASAAAGSSSAAIISDTTTYNAGDSIFLDGSAQSELQLSAGIVMGEFDVYLEGPNNMGDLSTVQLVFSTMVMMDDFLQAFSGGETVDGSLQFTDVALLVNDGTPDAAWTPPTTAYAGFVFDPGTGPLYGWLQLSYNGGTALQVTEWAYDDTGAAIEVAMIPEPGTALLVGLGLAALATGARRLARPPSTSAAG